MAEKNDDKVQLSDDELALLSAMEKQQMETQPWRIWLALANIALIAVIIGVSLHLMPSTPTMVWRQISAENGAPLNYPLSEQSTIANLRRELDDCRQGAKSLVPGVEQGQSYWLSVNDIGLSLTWLDERNLPTTLIVGLAELEDVCGVLSD